MSDGRLIPAESVLLLDIDRDSRDIYENCLRLEAPDDVIKPKYKVDLDTKTLIEIGENDD